MISERTGRKRHYECRNCNRHLHATSYRAVCPDCGGELRNIAVPRE